MSFAQNFRKRWNQPQGYGEILRVGLPLVAGMASSTVMQFTDRYFLAYYSVDAIAAALPASLASMTIMLTMMGLCGYVTVLVAQYMGAGAPRRIGPALWQGIWCAILCGLVLIAMWWTAPPLFAYAGHEAHIQAMEVDYFRILTTGSGFALLSATFGSFFSGRGQTRPVMVANIAAALLNIPLDYLFIFGGLGIPSMGIVGAGIATVIGWIFGAAILGCLVFTRKNDALYGVRTGWRFEGDMFRRLLRFGLPSGFNLFLELIGTTWFAMELGIFGTVALAASNIAFSINSLIFVPALGVNMAVSSLVGQAMGRQKPLEAERVAWHSLHLVAAYMLPVSVLIAIFAPQLMELFRPGDMSPAEFVPVRELGVVLLYFIVIYSFIDCGNIVYFGALKGAGDTMGVLRIMSGALVLLLIIPIGLMKYSGTANVYTLWIAFTVYVILLAVAAMLRFYRRGWHNIRVVETPPAPE